MKKTLSSKLKENVESCRTQQDELMNARKKQLAELKNKEKRSFKWLTEHSRSFLAAGYITENYTPELRVKEIADRAEEILGINYLTKKW